MERLPHAAALLVALHVDGDYAAVIDQGPALLERPVTVRTREMATWTSRARVRRRRADLDALTLATRRSTRPAMTQPAPSALWALAETHWLAGRLDAALAASERAAALPVVGYPGHVGAALVGAWAAFELGRPVPDAFLAAIEGAPPNLSGADREAGALQADDPAAALTELECAIEAWRPASVRARARATWAAGVATARAGELHTARELLDAADRECEVVGLRALQNRVDSARHRLGWPVPVRDADGDLSRRQQEVLRRVAAGATTADIAADAVRDQLGNGREPRVRPRCDRPARR